MVQIKGFARVDLARKRTHGCRRLQKLHQVLGRLDFEEAGLREAYSIIQDMWVPVRMGFLYLDKHGKDVGNGVG